jgi:proteasome accessory factor B
MKPSQIHRLLKLISLLQAGKGFNADGLAEQCRVSRRTVYRDLDVLRKSGLPLGFDESDGTYALSGPAYLPPVDFTPEEALALVVLCHELGDRDGVPFLGAARSAAIKLQGSLPRELRQQLRKVAAVVEIQPPPNNPLEGQAGVYQQLVAALAARRCVRIGYRSLFERREIETVVSPYRLLFSRRSWYVIGRSTLHRGVRTFNLARIVRIETLEDAYPLPRGFSLDRFLRNAWHLIPERGPDREVLVRFSPIVAENVAEVLWHKTQRVTFCEDGSMDFRVTVSGLNEISWWILGYADQAEVIEPPELRRLVARRVAGAAARYAAEIGATAETRNPVPSPSGRGLG